MAHAKGHNIQCFGGNATKVNVYQELLVSDLHTLEDYSEKAHHVLVSCALDMIIIIFLFLLVFVFQKTNFLRDFQWSELFSFHMLRINHACFLNFR